MGTIGRVDWARTQVELDELCEIWRLKPVGTGEGTRRQGSEQYPADFVRLSQNRPCRVDSDETRRVETQTGGRTVAVAGWDVSFEHDEDVTARDVVIVTSMQSRRFDMTGRKDGGNPIVKVMEAVERT